MSNIKKLAKTLVKNANQAGYVTIDQDAFDKIKAALEVAGRLATSHADGGKMLDISNAGLEAVKTLTRPMSLGHAYDILARMNGLKDFNGLSAALLKDRAKPAAERVMVIDGSVDYCMSSEAKDNRVWVEVGAISVYIKRTHEGVIVDLFATGCEDTESLGSVAMEWVDAESAMRQSGRGWLIHSPSEEEAGDGAGFWSNIMGWCQEDEATVFTETEKSQFNLPISSGNDAHWVSLAEHQTDEAGHLNGLPIHVLDDEQPTTCPKCGSRTEFDDLSGGRQHHVCLNCGYAFIGEFDEASA